jgi:hypothetical protein
MNKPLRLSSRHPGQTDHPHARRARKKTRPERVRK